MNIDLEYFTQLVNLYDYKSLCLYCTKDISTLPMLIKILKNNYILDKDISLLLFNLKIKLYDNKFILQIWLYSILNNPFNFLKILDTETKKLIFDFLTKYIIREKLSIKILVKIFNLEDILPLKQFNQWEILCEYSKINKLEKSLLDYITNSLENIKKNNTCNTTNKNNDEINNENYFLDIEKSITQITIQKDTELKNSLNINNYKHSNNTMSKNFDYLNENYNNFETINHLLIDNNDIVTLIYKFKILSFQYKYYKIDLNLFLSFLNFNNFKFGYSLCRSILKIVKYYDINLFCSYITQQLNVIFANEMLWINALHILGSLIFQNKNLYINNSILETSVNYNFDYTNYRSALVREYSLFLVYCLLRSKKQSDFLVNLTIYKFIFDNNYKIRYIASSILSDFFKIQLEYKRHKDIINSYYKINKIYKINIVRFIKKEKEISTIKLQNDLIWKYNIDSKINYDSYENILDYINTGYYIYYGLTYNKIKNTNENYVKTFLKIELIKFYKFRFIENLIEIYLEVLFMVKKYNFESINNIKFLISKNFYNDLICKIIWDIDDTEIYDYIYKFRKRNNKIIIISNIKNKKYSEDIIKFYKQCIHKQDNIEFVINIYKSIKYLENICIFKEEIYQGLENYYIGSRGDVSYEIRRECLELIQKIDSKMYETYFIRYMVDKNKYLRDYLLIKIKNDQFNLCIEKNRLTFESIINHPEIYDGKNVCIGLLGYLCTSDNYNFETVINIFLNKIDFYDKFIKKIILTKYERVFDYIFKLIVLLFERGQRKLIFEWVELLKNYNINKYQFIKNLKQKDDA